VIATGRPPGGAPFPPEESPVRRIRIALPLFLSLTVALAAPPAVAADDWSLPDIDGRRVSLADALAGGPVLVAFWASWCAPCMKELPHLEELAAAHAGELTVLAVDADSPRSAHKVPALVRSRGFDHLVVLLDTDGEIQRRYQVTSLPFLVLLDRDGSVAYSHQGYREGDEQHLREAVERLLSPRPSTAAAPAGSTPDGVAGGVLQVSDQFQYRYNTDTQAEITENWLDAIWTGERVRLGVLFNHEQPSEEGRRRDEIRHRWVEFTGDHVRVRAGHFYGMFGRGLLLSLYEDRVIRVDTALDGFRVDAGVGRWRGTFLSGTPSNLDLDLRGLDQEVDLGRGLVVGASALTWQSPSTPVRDGELLRDYVVSGRVGANAAHGGAYLEWGARKQWLQADGGDWHARWGHAVYAGLNVFGGGFGLSLEGKDYDRFTILPAADGREPVNNPPSLTREHLYTLLNRHPYLRDADSERGYQVEGNWSGGDGWSILLNNAYTEDQDGRRLFREFYGHVERRDWGPWFVRAGLDRRDVYDPDLQREQRYWTVVAEATWHRDSRRAVGLKFEQQHVEDPGNAFGTLGEYDQQFTTLEYTVAPHWSWSAILETNDKFDTQRDAREDDGPFPALQVAYVTPGGSQFTLWAGKRLGGYLCAGGVCKYEPAFEGVELFGTIRY